MSVNAGFEAENEGMHCLLVRMLTCTAQYTFTSETCTTSAIHYVLTDLYSEWMLLAVSVESIPQK